VPDRDFSEGLRSAEGLKKKCGQEKLERGGSEISPGLVRGLPPVRKERARMGHGTLVVNLRAVIFRSRYGKSSAPHGIGGGAQLDFNVVPEAVQALHQLLFREVREIAAHKAGNLGLRNPHSASRFLLCQAQTAHRARDFDDQAGLDLELFGISQTKIPKHVAGAGFDFNAVKGAICNFESPLRVPRLS
jgi:hypothetical protein